jgi:hypothetical protein
MQTSSENKNIIKALIKFHHSVGKAAKTADNPFLKSKYANLETILDVIKQPLEDSGLTFVQFPTGENQLTTMLMHESGEWMSDTFTLKPVDSKPQSVGSAITYMRRYSIGAVLGIATEEDDDANKAQKQATRAKETITGATSSNTDKAVTLILASKNRGYLKATKENITNSKLYSATDKEKLISIINGRINDKSF